MLFLPLFILGGLEVIYGVGRGRRVDEGGAGVFAGEEGLLLGEQQQSGIGK